MASSTGDEADPAALLLGRSSRELEAAAPQIIAGVEASVRRRTWANADADWERLEPYWSERHGRRPVTKGSAEPPSDLSDSVEYGYDESGTIVIARRFRAGLPAPAVDSEMVRLVSPDGHPVQLEFDSRTGGARLWQLSRARYERDRLVEVESWSMHPIDGVAASRERYEYEGDRLRFITDDREPPAPGTPWSTRYEIVYDEEGAVTLVRSISLPAGNGGDEHAEWDIVYRRAPAAGVRKALRRVETELPELVIQWAKRQGLGEPVYCLAIAYDAESEEGMPPALGLGTARERDDWQTRLGLDGARDLIWNPAEFAHYDPEPLEFTRDREFVEACQIVNQQWSSSLDEAQPRKLLVKCAKQLAARDWSDVLDTDSMFAVYAIDLELEDLDRNLRASAPREVRRWLDEGSR